MEKKEEKLDREKKKRGGGVRSIHPIYILDTLNIQGQNSFWRVLKLKRIVTVSLPRLRSEIVRTFLPFTSSLYLESFIVSWVFCYSYCTGLRCCWICCCCVITAADFSFFCSCTAVSRYTFVQSRLEAKNEILIRLCSCWIPPV